MEKRNRDRGDGSAVSKYKEREEKQNERNNEFSSKGRVGRDGGQEEEEDDDYDDEEEEEKEVPNTSEAKDDVASKKSDKSQHPTPLRGKKVKKAKDEELVSIVNHNYYLSTVANTTNNF